MNCRAAIQSILHLFQRILDTQCSPDCEGLVATTNAAGSGDAYVSSVPGACGFPTQGGKYLIVPATGPGTWGTFLAICADPAHPFGLVLTAATQIDVAGGPLPASFTGGTPTGNSFYTSTQIVFTSGLTIPFFGALYSSAWVNSCGSITFTGGDGSGYLTGSSLLNGGLPRIAPLWDQLGTGLNDYSETAAGLVVSWTNYSEAVPTNSSDFAMTIDAAGNISFAYGFVEASGVNGPMPLVGITPGVGSPVGSAIGAPIDLSVQAVGVGYVGLPNESIFEIFPGSLDIVPPCGLVIPPSGGQLNFTPNPGSIPGDQGYTAF